MTDLLSRHRLGKFTGRSLRTVDRWLECGLPTRNVRASVRFNAIDAADWLRARYGTGVPLNRLLHVGAAVPTIVEND